MIGPIYPLVAKIDLALFFLEKTVPPLHGILPLGGDHVSQFGILSMAATVLDDAAHSARDFIAMKTAADEVQE